MAPSLQNACYRLGKNSKRGRLALVQDREGTLTTVENVGENAIHHDLLEIVFEDGDVLKEYDLDSIRLRVRLSPGLQRQDVAR